MQTILTFCAIICALVFGISLALLKEKKIIRRPWNIVFKIFIQIIGTAAFLCTFFSLSGQHHLFVKAPPLWAIAVISIAPCGIFSAIGNMLTATRHDIRLFFQKGLKTLDKDSRRGLFFIAMMFLTGSLAITYIMPTLPTLLYPVMVLILGGAISLGGWVILAICLYILKLVFRSLTNLRSIEKKYWQWLIN